MATSKRFKFLERIVLVTLLFACVFIGFLFVGFIIIGNDDWVSCQIENIRNGHFLGEGLATEIVVTGDASSNRIDFTRIEKFEKICIIEMYTY